MTNNPIISVIVVTYKREKVLCETLDYLTELSFSDYELVVIDQTSVHEPETEQFLHDFSERSPERYRWYRLSRANLPYARNVAAMLATGRYLLYCDDDIIPPADWIERHLENLEESGVGAVTGGISVEHKKTPVQSSPCVLLPNGRIHQYWDFEVPRTKTDSLIGCNMSMPRKLAFEVGLFDENYIGPYWEETDFSVRISRSGHDIIYDPTAAVVHLGHQTGGVRSVKGVDDAQYYCKAHFNNAYFFAKNMQQRYLPWMLKRELGWILIKQGILQGHSVRTVPSLRGVFRGYVAGIRARTSRRS